MQQRLYGYCESNCVAILIKICVGPSNFKFFSLCNFYLLVVNFSYVKCRWHAVASWTWDAQDETCGICRMAFDGCCPDCKLPGDDCPLSKLLLMLSLDFHSCHYICINLSLVNHLI